MENVAGKYEKMVGESHKACRIVVVDDHAIMRDGVSAILNQEADLEVVGNAQDGKAAVMTVRSTTPDVVIMDLSMPKTDGVTAIENLKREFPEIRIVVLTFHKEDVHIHSALEAGADAYVLKDDGRGELLSAIRNAAAGKSYLSPGVCGRVIAGYVGGPSPAQRASSVSWNILTAREREVLKLIAEGYKTREIADYLSLSKKTIEKHRGNLMRKLDLHSVAAVTAYAIDNGLLSH
jgi:DNA-binding NarL/FixJ family response regulator